MDQSILYKSPLYLELHRFRSMDWQKGINRGFKLSLAELRALTALTILLNETEYEGDHQERITLESWKNLGETPALSFKWNQYLDAFHGEEGKGRRGQQAERAKKALYKLSETDLQLSYYRKNGEPTINQKCRLVKILDNTRGRTRRGLTLVFHPIFIDNIHSFHVPKPVNLFNQVCHYLKVQKPKKQVVLFIEWLLTKNNSLTEISKDNLIKRMWLEPLWLARKKSRVEQTLQESVEAAMGLGYLCNFSTRRAENSKKNGVIFKFEPNPELCKRVKLPKDQTD